MEWHPAATHADASGDCDTHLDALADPNAHAYQGIVDPNSNPHLDPMAYIDTYSNAYRDLDTLAHPYAYSHMDSNLHLDTCPAHAHSHFDGHSYLDAHSAHAHPNMDSNLHLDACPAHSHFDGYAYLDAHVDSHAIPHNDAYAYAYARCSLAADVISRPGECGR